MRTTSYGIANSMIASKELKAPLVIVKKIDGGNVKYKSKIVELINKFLGEKNEG